MLWKVWFLSRREICGCISKGPHHITSLRTSFFICKEQALRTVRTLGKNTPFKSHTKKLGQSLTGFSQPEATFLGQPCCLLSSSGEDPLEKEMATLSSILAWRIPWTRSRAGYNSIGLQRVAHDWSDVARMHAGEKAGEKALYRIFCLF